MNIDFKKMELTSFLGSELMFKSIDNFDNAKLRYHIDHKDALFIYHDQKAYIQAKITPTDEKSSSSNVAGYLKTELNLYHISVSEEEGKEKEKKDSKLKKPKKEVVEFYTRNSFKQAFESEDQIWKPMPIMLDKKKGKTSVIGSFMYE